MRPTPAETASAVARLLDEWAADQTQSQHMRWMLRRASGVVAQTDWEDASAGIAASNARLMLAIEAASAWIDGLEPLVADAYAPAWALMREAQAGSSRPVEPTSLPDRNELNATLRAAIDEFVSSLEADRTLKGHDSRRRLGYRCLLQSIDDL